MGLVHQHEFSPAVGWCLTFRPRRVIASYAIVWLVPTIPVSKQAWGPRDLKHDFGAEVRSAPSVVDLTLTQSLTEGLSLTEGKIENHTLTYKSARKSTQPEVTD